MTIRSLSVPVVLCGLAELQQPMTRLVAIGPGWMPSPDFKVR